MIEGVYVLCAATSIVCAVLLLRGYLSSRAPLLLWSGLCFACLAVENVLLFVDLVVYPEVDLIILPTVELSMIRRLLALLGLMLLIYGLVQEFK